MLRYGPEKMWYRRGWIGRIFPERSPSEKSIVAFESAMKYSKTLTWINSRIRNLLYNT